MKNKILKGWNINNTSKVFIVKSDFLKKANKKPFLEPNVKWKKMFNDWMILGTGI